MFAAVNVYPSQYQLPELTAHVIALLERRRAAFDAWNDDVERVLLEEAKEALDEAGRQFKELADDPAFWQRTTELLMTVAIPRYFRVAKEQHALEQRKYDVWRGGDFIARAAFAVAGLVVGLVVLRTPIPDWLEPIPLAFFIGGPLIPDAQVWFAKRRYRKQLAGLVDEMKAEASDRRAYQPLGVDEHVAGGDALPAERTKERG